MDSATSPDDSGSELDGPDWPQPGGQLDEAPAPEPHINETTSVHSRNALSSGNQASPAKADYDSPQAGDEVDSPTSAKMSSRAYQLEMLDESLKHNVIVTMDTGSGKTQVAILRIKAELEKLSAGKIIWFLAPTVSLCLQQFEVIQIQAHAVPMKLLTSHENVDSWSAGVWDAILSDARVVVSTYQVLLDALSHAFVKMEHLALIVFDEAHHCVRKHAGSKIMHDFYHRQREAGHDVPAILGLTASPIMKPQIENLQTIEATLHAKCISPTLHREELVKYVKEPQISHVTYELGVAQYTEAMRLLRVAYNSLDILEDPYILRLSSNPTERNMRSLQKAVEKYDTFVQNEMKRFCSRSESVSRELGTWAADRYIYKVVTGYLERVADSSGDAAFFDQWIDEEKEYLSEVLGKITLPEPPESPRAAEEISDKVKHLLNELLSATENVVGIIFVKERVTVSMLCTLLCACPPIVERYRIGTVVGTSSHSARTKSISEFLDKPDLMALQNFRSGKINLLVATSVLEEGIDVPACNLVVCFDQPPTPKAFIQRRGRARMRDSKLVLFLEASSERVLLQWNSLEEEMKRQYQDEEREFRHLEALEESEQIGSTSLVVEATGARLDFDSAKQHLEHFCRVLSQGEYVDSRPDYIVSHQADDSGGARLGCTVVLPVFLPARLRQARSESLWFSEKNATKDAAFQAYKALYEEGLVNDNLLPFKQAEIPGVEGRLPEAYVEPPWKPWVDVAQAWKEPGERWLYSAGCYDGHELVGEYEILLPVQLDQPRPIQIFLPQNVKRELRFGPGQPISAERAAEMPDHTSTLLALHFAHRWPVGERQHVIQTVAKHGDISMDQIASVRFNPDDQDVANRQYLIRDQAKVPYLFTGMIPHKPPSDQVQHPFYEYQEKGPTDVPYLHLSKWTRRADFLHRSQGDPSQDVASTKPYSWAVPLSWAMVDTIPARHAEFGMLIPSILHTLEVMLVAKKLGLTLLRSVGITDQELLREAITSRGAAEPVNYERLEFLGDSVLKYCTSIQVSADHLEWPEGYLSFFRDRLIANSRLSRAAVEKGLTKFIVNKPFTGQKWRPLHVDDIIEQGAQLSGPERKLATKTLADVVESLIGASYQHGGIPKAMASISQFLDEVKWRPLEGNRETLFEATKDNALPSVLGPLEELIGYSFKKKALLTEAMTHASYVADAETRSLERLEFLGDSILDHVIVTKIYAVEPPLSHHEMHTLKTATVNADFIAFMVMEYGLHQRRAVVTGEGELGEQGVFRPLWAFMRHASVAIGLEQEVTAKRHRELRGDIRVAMERGTHYPWALLARLQAKKFYSDLFEALLGAVWVDSGSMDVCAGIVARFGILPYLDRMLRDKVHVQHPKEDLGKWAVTETVTYDVEVVEASDGAREYRCKVRVGERQVAEVDGGVSREEVKTKVAEAAVSVLAREKVEAASRRQ